MGNRAVVNGITPLHIEVALHYFKSQDADTSAYTGRDGDAVALVCHELAEAGLLEFAGGPERWKATNAMRLVRRINLQCSFAKKGVYATEHGFAP